MNIYCGDNDVPPNGKQFGTANQCYRQGRRAGFVGGLRTERANREPLIRQAKRTGLKQGNLAGELRKNQFMGLRRGEIRVGTLSVDAKRLLADKENKRLPVGQRLAGASRASGGVLDNFLITQLGYQM